MSHGDTSQTTMNSPAPIEGCSCVSKIHNILDQLRGEVLSDFYASLSLLQSARKVADTAVSCRICPKKYLSAIQNALALCTLVVSMSDCYEKLLRSLNEEDEGSGELSSPKSINIQGEPRQGFDAPVFNIVLEAEEWRTFSRKAIKTEIYGCSREGSTNQCFSELIERLEKRQREWHNSPPGVGFPPSYQVGAHEPKPSCLGLVTSAKKSLERLQWK